MKNQNIKKLMLSSVLSIALILTVTNMVKAHGEASRRVEVWPGGARLFAADNSGAEVVVIDLPDGKVTELHFTAVSIPMFLNVPLRAVNGLYVIFLNPASLSHCVISPRERASPHSVSMRSESEKTTGNIGPILSSWIIASFRIIAPPGGRYA